MTSKTIPSGDGRPSRFGSRISASRIIGPYWVRTCRSLPAGPRVDERQQDVRAVERRHRDQVEDHQRDVDLDEEAEDGAKTSGGMSMPRREQHPVRDGRRDGHDRGSRAGPPGRRGRRSAAAAAGSSGLTGVGFAQPKMNPLPGSGRSGRRSVPPTGSKWTHRIRATTGRAASPSRRPSGTRSRAWENSWIGSAKSRMIATRATRMISSIGGHWVVGLVSEPSGDGLRNASPSGDRRAERRRRMPLDRRVGRRRGARRSIKDGRAVPASWPRIPPP